MLTAIENRLIAAVTPLLPPGVPCRAGPSTGPAAGEDERVEVSAPRLSVAVPELDDLSAVRTDAFLIQIHSLDADGSALDYTLPDGVDGEIIEVEAPPGASLRPGDDYEVAGRVLRFYRAPPAGNNAVIITLRVGRAAGFQERRACSVRVGVHAWAMTTQRADDLLRAALGGVMASAVAPATVELPAADPRLRVRLLRPAVLIDRIERAAEKVDARQFIKATAQFIVRGELELTVTLGAAEVPRTIREIIYARPSAGNS